MNHRAARSFWKHYNALPEDVQQVANSSFAHLKQDPQHPSLHLKRVRHLWSSRVGIAYRALAIQHEDTLVWYWIGSHAEYDTLIGRS
ncbi:MAG TPA: hypothetical protein VD997_16050 [Phycisphaerales bacterium]|nr:hypothetical protein [Phycisphaerales bacterium]